MGGKLSLPNLDSKTQSGQNDEFKYVSITVQGWQAQMENASLALINIDPNTKTGNSLFAIFDGVRGFQVSYFITEIFVSVLINSEPYVQGSYQEALKYTFQKIDQLIFSEKGERRLQQIRAQNQGQALAANQPISDSTGSMASVVLLTKKKIYSAHIGDSKMYISRDSNHITLSENHKVDNFDEKLRIQKGRGQVSDGRINGNMNVSRAFGFGKFKQNKNIPWDEQIIACCPEIKTLDRNMADQFLFMACDGIWAAHDKKQSALIKKIKQMNEENGNNLKQTLQEVIKISLGETPFEENEIGTKNMTAILVRFNEI